MDPKLITGTLEMIILDIVARAPSYGYPITQTALTESRGYFELKEGSLYPALHRLERQQLLASFWDKSEEGRRRKYYKITPQGRRSLKKKKDEWSRFTGAVKGVLGAHVAIS